MCECQNRDVLKCGVKYEIKNFKIKTKQKVHDWFETLNKHLTSKANISVFLSVTSKNDVTTGKRERERNHFGVKKNPASSADEEKEGIRRHLWTKIQHSLPLLPYFDWKSRKASCLFRTFALMLMWRKWAIETNRAEPSQHSHLENLTGKLCVREKASF